jgi:iron complex transport system permease protein
VAIAVGALVLVGVPLMLTGRTLDAFAFGETAAASLGVAVSRTRWLLLIATALLTGAMVSVSGSIGFVGLVLPHAIRLLVGSANRRVLPLSALLGAVFLVLADTVARTAFDPRELPVGIVTAIVGAPLFVLLLARRTVRA